LAVVHLYRVKISLLGLFNWGGAFYNPYSLAQTGHIVSAVYLVLVCKKSSNGILKSAPGRAEIHNKFSGSCLLTSIFLHESNVDLTPLIDHKPYNQKQY
jgi:hypothetical protein